MATPGRTKSFDDLEGALSSFRTKAAQDIAWNNINFGVKGKVILDNVWGHVPSGKVAAIMGPSGAGKSSLLNVLAGRSAAAGSVAITGDIFVAGRKINPVTFRENIAYVMQDDSLLATATPREALTFSANLRLPNTTTQKQLKEVVDRLISDLGLDSCADTMIGGALIKGISGGQRKRTSVGVELITDPALLFLDEPTSGLDSYSAYNMIQLLKHVAESNATVLCTIHQPSSEVFQLFDLVIFMKDGLIFYQGPVSAITTHFSKFGYDCPNNYNPSDFVMHISQTETHEILSEKGMFQLSAERERSLTGTKIVPASSADPAAIADKNFGVPIRSSWGKQFYWLCKRELLNIRRDTTALAARFGITMFLSLLFGLIFLGAGNRDDAMDNNFNSHFGAITFVLISAMFGPAQSVMLAFPFERPMFMREFATGTYRATAYFMTKTMLELPLTLVQTFVQFIMCYYMISLQGNFMYIVLAAWGLGCASCSVAVMIGCLVADVKDVSELAPLLFVPQLLFAGFFIRTSLIPVFLRWAQYLCAIKYAVNLVLLTEFNVLNKSCQGAAQFNCKNVLINNDIKVEDTYVYILVIFALFVVFRTIGAAILIQKARRFY